MGNSLQFSKAQGFVALPCALLDLDLTPGAFRLLAELCRMANKDGQCWPSLGQLSERTGRSKASLSAYLTELRSLGLVDTATQRMANGYNYRLKYTLPFWKNWRASLGQNDVETQDPQIERSDQPAECRVNSKNQSHENHRRVVDDHHHDSLEKTSKRWQDLTQGVPFPSFNRTVSSDLIKETRRLVSQIPKDDLSEPEVKTVLREIWTSQKIPVEESTLNRMATQLLTSGAGQKQLDALRDEVAHVWKPHWRKPPSAEQFAEMWTSAKARAPQAQYKLVLESYLRRWAFSEKQLQRDAPSRRLAA